MISIVAITRNRKRKQKISSPSPMTDDDPSRDATAMIGLLNIWFDFLVSFIILQMFHLEIKILICKWKCTSSYSLILTHSHQDMFKASLILWTNTKIATVIIHYGTFSILHNFTNVNLEIKILILIFVNENVQCTSSYSLTLTHSHQDMFKTSLILWTNTKIATVVNEHQTLYTIKFSVKW